MSIEVEQIGACALYRGDCYELLPVLAADALVSDPPYGIGFDWTKWRRNRHSQLQGGSRNINRLPPSWHSNVIGDTQPFDPCPWLDYPQIILWGANHYAASLPNSGAWLIWDKREGGTSDSFADAELAWTNLRGPTRLHRQLWRGLVRRGEENPIYGPKLHPAQKPLALMRWCVQMTTGCVLDPYMGSATTGIACVELGRPFIGVEIDERFFQIACQRITAAYAQPDLFVLTPRRPVQQNIFAEMP